MHIRERFSIIAIISFVSLIFSSVSIIVGFYTLHTLKYLDNKLNLLRNQSNTSLPQVIHYNMNHIYKEITVPIVAVTTEGEGVLGYLHIKAIPGHGNILIETNPFSEIDLQYSLDKAVSVAKMVTKKYSLDYDFIFSYDVGNVQVIGGESAGAAACLGVIALISNKSIREGVVITGTIELNGKIGKVSGIFEKAKAAADANYNMLLLPEGQSLLVYYEKENYKKEILPGYYVYKVTYVPKTLDLKEYAKEEWNMAIIEVNNIYDAMNYMLK